MHDCILALFWPKKTIIEFLKSVGCDDSLAAKLEEASSRHQIVVECFDKLIKRQDRGFTIFQVMVDRLSNWSYFDPYYFEQLRKLDRVKAEQNIAALRAMVQSRNQSTEFRRNEASTARQKQARNSNRTALLETFKSIYGDSASPQKRGVLFEQFLKNLFNKNSVAMGDPFRLDGEQIDGTFKFEGENYIVEAKWQDPTASTSQLYTFAHKVDGKMHGRGLFISVSGFSNEGIRAIVHGKHIQTMLMDGEDISHILEERLTLEDVLDYKIRAAQTRGDVYVCALRKGSKV